MWWSWWWRYSARGVYVEWLSVAVHWGGGGSLPAPYTISSDAIEHIWTIRTVAGNSLDNPFFLFLLLCKFILSSLCKYIGCTTSFVSAPCRLFDVLICVSVFSPRQLDLYNINGVRYYLGNIHLFLIICSCTFRWRCAILLLQLVYLKYILILKPE